MYALGEEVDCAKDLRVASPMPDVAPTKTAVRGFVLVDLRSSAFDALTVL